MLLPIHKFQVAALAAFLSSVCVASAQTPVVASFGQNGVLVCTNLAAGSVASVEWASSLAGPWQTNWAGLEAVTVAPDGTFSVSVPMFYRVRGIARSTAPTAPTAATANASALTGTTATLNGSGIPGNLPTTGWFRYSTVSPGTGNDTAGTRLPASGGVALGSGSYVVAYSQSLSGLSSGTTYYCWAVVSNSLGVAFGSVVSFTPPMPPTTTTASASSISSTGAYLNGNSTPNGAATAGWFRYSTVNPGTANDTSGTRVPATGGTALGSGWSAVSFSQYLSGLSQGTTYYFWAIATNSVGTSFGSVLSFTTPAAPTVTTTAANSVTSTSATLNGTANPNRASTYGYFRYSTTNPGTPNDTAGTRLPASSGSDSSLGAGSSAVAYSQALSGLTPGTTYYFWAVAYNSYGTSYGPILSFTTSAAAPTASTGSPSQLTGTTATLNGTGVPNGASATGWFRYSTVSPGTGNDTAGTRAPATGGVALGSGSSAVGYSQALTGLSPGTTYYCWAVVSNSLGVAFGSVVSFTPPMPPTATTSSASSITGTSAYLNGNSTPNGAATAGWFRYSTVNPGTGNDTSGTRVPTTGGTALGSGWSAVSFSQYLSGLSQGTTYYFWAIATNSVGTSFGSVLSFTTPAAPTVTTAAASSVTSTSATLNGTANPNRASTYGYFRYSTTNPGTPNDTAGTRLPASSGSDSSLGAGSSAVAYSQALSGLTLGTTYYFWAVAYNGYGTSFGPILSFTAN